MFLINKNLNFFTNNRLYLSTLGPKGTSSEYVAKKFLSQLDIMDKKVILHSSFEKAYESVQKNTSDAVLVANAYSNIDMFYMDTSLELLATNIESTPPYGIAVRKDFDISLIKKFNIIEIASHKAPIKRLDCYINDKNSFFYKKQFKIEICNSTSIAAKMVATKRLDFCLTNEKAKDEFDLIFVSKKIKIDMVWSIFSKENILPILLYNKIA